MKPYALQWFALLGLVLFLGVAVAPSINASSSDQDVIEKSDYDLSIIIAFFHGKVKNVRYDPYNMNLRLFFDVEDATIIGFYSWDWNDLYFAEYKLNETNHGIGIKYHGLNKARAYFFPNTAQFLCGIITTGRICR